MFYAYSSKNVTMTSQNKTCKTSNYFMHVACHLIGILLFITVIIISYFISLAAQNDATLVQLTLTRYYSNPIAMYSLLSEKNCAACQNHRKMPLTACLALINQKSALS